MNAAIPRIGLLSVNILRALLLSVCAFACEAESGPEAVCPDRDCGAGLACLRQRCVPEGQDPDNDGLSVLQELAHGLDPLTPDSDADGIPDLVEWGSGATPRDRDGDGIPDALESQDLDLDGDCVPDVWDDDPKLATQPPAGWVEQLCSRQGVCAHEGVLLEMVCAGGVANCLVKGSEAYQSRETLCDGLDNDCDGMTDEGIWWGVASLGAVCWGEGACGTGRVECAPDSKAPVCSSMPGGSGSLAKPEVCDGIDNNCDGTVDEGLFYDGIAVGQPCEGTGACGLGVVACSTGLLPICSTMPGGPDSQAREEICDGSDNDCDGYVDEEVGPPAQKGCPTQGVCAVPWSLPTLACVEGAWRCIYAGVESYEPEYERTCDNLDNDCDGHVDEDFALAGPNGAVFLGQPCGVGPCYGGVAICAADGNGAVCSTYANASQEVCDGADNDCDGVIDNGLEYEGRRVGEPCMGVGACGPGVVVCSLSKEVDCSSNPGLPGSGAQPEKCDWVDNDCDGEVDEGMGPGHSCAAQGVCASATFPAVCAGGFWRCDYSALPGFQAEELSCDGVDNDCDGVIDEGTHATFLAATAGIIQDAPPHLAGISSLLVGDEVWVLGGRGVSLSGAEVCPDAWWRQQKDGTWLVSDAPWTGREQAAAVARPQGDGVVWVGGWCHGTLAGDAWHVSGTGSTPLSLPSQVSSRYGHALFAETETGALLVVGGIGEGGSFAGSYVCAQEMQCQGPLPGFPLLIEAASCEDALANRGYLFGGSRPDGSLSNQLYVLDLPSQMVVSFEHSFGPSPRSNAAMFCRGDSVWVAGGIDEAGTLLSDVWAYSLANHSWASKPPLPVGMAGGVLAERSGVMVLQAGMDADGRMDRSPGVALSLQGTWQAQAEPVPQVGVGALGAADPYAGVVCVTGGLETTGGGPAISNRVWCSQTTAGWEVAGALQQPLEGGVFVYDAFEDRFLALGGVPGDEGTCRAEWLRPWTGEGGLLPWCDGQELPLLTKGSLAAVDPVGLILYLLVTSSQEGGISGLWLLDLTTGSFAQGPTPAALQGMDVVRLLFDTSRGVLWGVASTDDNNRLVAWFPGSEELLVDLWLDGLGQPCGAWLDGDSGQLLLLGNQATQGTLVMPGGTLSEGGPPPVVVPAQLQGFWPESQWLTHWSSPGSRDQMALGRLDRNLLTQPTSLQIQMRCK